MKQLFFVGALVFGMTSAIRAEEVNIDLPAGGTYVFQNFDSKYTINCTAEPVEPTVLSKTCGCFGFSGVRPVRLKMNVLLSNGKTVEYTIANTETLSECEAKLKDYESDCRAR